MRTLFVLWVGLCLAPLATAQTNKIQMVTYFPVPYVAYNDVTVTQFCDVGILNQCQLNVGPGSPSEQPFALDVRSDSANPANVLNTGRTAVTSGRLNLNSAGPSSKVYSQDASHGMDAGVAGNANSELSFNHAANVSSVNGPRSVTGTSSSMLRALNVFPSKLSTDFPGCASGVTWKRLPLGYSGTSSANEAYLVCGGKAGTGSCAGSKPATSQACSGCGTQTRNVWCENGIWQSSAWTACPVKPNETVSCGNAAYECGGSATRTVSCSGGTWTASAWNYSACYNKYGGGQTRNCSAGCGTETSTATCSGASWSGSCWSPYGGYTSNCSEGCGQYGASSSCSGATGYWNNCYYPSKPSCSCSGYGGCGSATASSSCSGGSCNYSGCFSPYGGGVQSTASCDSGYSGTKYYRCNASCGGSTGCYWDTSGCTRNPYCGVSCATGQCSSQTCVPTSSGGYCSGTATNKTCTKSCSCPSGYTGTATCTPDCSGGTCNTSSCTKTPYCSVTCATGQCSSQTCVPTSSGGYCSGTATNKTCTKSCSCPTGYTGTAKCVADCSGGTCDTSGCTKDSGGGGSKECAEPCTMRDAKGNCCYKRGSTCWGQDWQGVTRVCAMI